MPMPIISTPDSTTRAQEVVAEQNQLTPPTDESTKLNNKKLNDTFRQQIEVCKKNKSKLTKNWSVSIDYRRGKPFTSQSDDDQVSVNMDWSLTKTKQAALFSQVPQVRVTHPPDSGTAGPWLSKYNNKLNDTLVLAGIEAAMDECLPDCINAAGFGAVVVSYESLTIEKDIPAIDLSILPPEAQAEIIKTKMIGGKPLPMTTAPETVDKRYVVSRISPSDFLWPVDFTSSDFNKAPWLGHTGRITWPEALQRKWATEEDKDKVLGETTTSLDKLTNDVDQDNSDPKVEFDELFYWDFSYDEGAKSFSTIHHLVFLSGKTEPVIDESWKGQKIDEASGSVIGALKLPVRVLTLVYITDETIPPSDSAIGRPQVNEINKARSQMIKQRERNVPMRYGDVNRLDPTIMQSLMKGTWLNVIPVQGDGSRVLGEVAKANFPPEDFTFDQVAKTDLNEEWSIGPNQRGSGADVETKGESNEIAQSFQTRIGRDRAKVGSFFVGIAEVVGGLICLFEDPAEFGDGFDPAFSKTLAFSILADSTVLVDANQRLKRMNDFLDSYAKSGLVNIEAVLREISILSGLDPNTTIKVPDPQPPVQPNISLRLTGAADMMNPLMLAFMIESKQAPKPESIEMAKQLIQAAVLLPQPPPPPQMGPDGQPLPPGPPLPGEVPPPGAPVPLPPPSPVPVGEANPNMTILPKIGKRSESGGTQ